MPTSLRRGLTVLAAGSIVFGALVAPAQADESSSYVALGDSFVAGPLIPDQTGSPAGCLRSSNNYPSLVADQLGASDFVDVSCSGATTENMLNEQSTTIGTNDPQLDALSADTSLVSLGIGGNDVGFVDILVDCLLSGSTQPSDAPCQKKYTNEDGSDQLLQRISEVKPKIANTLDQIKQRSPNANVVVVGYPAIMPESDGCWPKVPLAKGDIPYLDATEQALNAALADSVADSGATYVDTYDRGHDICTDKDARWLEGIIPSQPAAPVHPNAAGMQALAQSTLEAIG